LEKYSLNAASAPGTSASPSGRLRAFAEQVARAKLPWLKKQVEKVASLERRAMELEKSQPIDCNTARQRLVERLDALCRKYGYAYNKVSVRNQRTRWGSCSAKNDISLNLQLIRLPADLIDYVILHELVHTRIKNHSQAFWDRLSGLVGDAKTLDRRLNQYPLIQPGACQQVSD
jgi:hypothetical protein